MERKKTLAAITELKIKQRVLAKNRLEVRRLRLLEEKLKATLTTTTHKKPAASQPKTKESELKSLNKKSTVQENNKNQGKEQTASGTETIDQIRKTIISASLKFPKPGIVVEVIDILTNTTTLYPSIRKACEAMDTTIGSIHRRNNLQIAKGIHTPYRKRYLITFLKS